MMMMEIMVVRVMITATLYGVCQPYTNMSLGFIHLSFTVGPGAWAGFVL